MPRAQKKQSLIASTGSDAAQISRGLKSFSRTAQALSSRRPRLIGKYPQRWVGLHDGRVAADAKTLSALLARLRKMGIPATETIIRYIDKHPKTFIL
jgi:hypothetical protein